MRSLLILTVAIVAILCMPVFAQDVEYVSSALWSGVNDVDVVDNYAYCAFTNGLVILDVTDPSNPSFVSQLYCHSRGERIVVAGNCAYLAARDLNQEDCNLKIIGITDPSNPVLVGSYVFPGQPYDISFAENYIYITWNDYTADIGGIEIIEVSDPSNPFFAGNYNLDTDNYANGLSLSENHAYIAWNNGSGTGGIEIIDVNNPMYPTFAGRYDTTASARDVIVSGDYAYLVGSDLSIIDISVHANPACVANCETPSTAIDICLSGNHAYVTVGSWYEWKGLCIIDVSDVENPFIAGSSDHMWIYRISVSNGYAYVTYAYVASSASLEIIDISDQSNPVWVGSYGEGGVEEIYTSGNYAYTVIQPNCFQIIDVTDPYNLRMAGSYYFNDDSIDPEGIFVSGNYAYVICEYYGLVIIDVSDPENPTLAGYYDTPGYAYDVFVSGSYAYIACGETGLLILDITNPSDPTYVSNSIMSAVARGAYVVDNYAYVVWYHNAPAHGGIQVMDITNPHVPVFYGVYDMGAVRLREVFVFGNYAYIADYDYGLKIIDVSDPLDMEMVGNYDTPGYAYDVFVSGNYACLANSHGLLALDISNPSNPVFASSYDTPGNAQKVSVSGDHVYVDDGSSLMILRFDPLTYIDQMQAMPNHFSLEQNYPNPFNPSTTIQYSLPEPSAVSVNIYDILGRRVEHLNLDQQPAGEHQITWNADNHPSGVYFYRIQAGEYTETKKMALLR